MCQLLNEKPKYSGIKDMPSATQLETIKNHLIDLKNTQVLSCSLFFIKTFCYNFLLICIVFLKTPDKTSSYIFGKKSQS